MLFRYLQGMLTDKWSMVYIDIIWSDFKWICSNFACCFSINNQNNRKSLMADVCRKVNEIDNVQSAMDSLAVRGKMYRIKQGGLSHTGSVFRHFDRSTLRASIRRDHLASLV